MRNFETDHNNSQESIEDLWNKYLFTSYHKNRSSIKYAKLSKYDYALLKYIISKINIEIKEKKNKWITVNTAKRYKSKKRKKEIVLYPLLSYLIKKRNESVKDFDKFSGNFLLNIIYFLVSFTLYILFFFLLPISIYGINFLK